MSETPSERELAAPAELNLATRMAFRDAAFRVLDGLPPRRGRLTINLGQTRRVDSTGLQALIMVRRYAEARGIRVRLRGVRDELRALFERTKLDRQFDIEAGAGD